MALATLLWTVMGVVVHWLGTFAWRNGCMPGRRTLKVYEFNVHTEVALTACGMQLCTGRALLVYVLWALGVYVCHAALLVMPLCTTRSRPGCATRWLAAGSTPALHIVRLLTNSMAKACGSL